jgi:succinate-semialdehyde dehydrogenase/glutarate-semialdehyde dehydrogenase
MQSFNPYTNKVIFNYKEDSFEDIANKLAASQTAFDSWKKTTFSERATLFLKLAEIILEDKIALATIITSEIGKPIKQSLAEVEKCAWVCRYYAENAKETLKDKHIATDASSSFVRYAPLGVVLAIMPWNYPFWQYFRFISPNLMAGNVGVLKHASNVSGSALAIEGLFNKAGFPKNVSQTLLVSSKNTHKIIENKIVKAVTLTGSLKAGSEVASLSGKLIKKTVLELGGNNALIVFEDTDIENAVNTIINARYQNAGQSCIAGKRLLVHENIVEEIVSKLITKVSKLKFLNPLEENAEIGVLATEQFAQELENQMNRSIAQGAKLVLGGKRDKAFFEPTILTNVTNDMAVFKEETFGPLLAVTTFKTDKEAITLSNDSDFGLGVSIFTKDNNRISTMINELEEGAVFVNELVKSDPRLPFGGIKKSGYGRELSTDALFEFMNVKTVYVK